MSVLFGKVCQNGYVVRDIRAAMDHWVNVMGVGPWYYIDKVKRYLPQAKLEVLNSVTEFFEGRGEELDALVFAAEAGSAWTLLYPAYTVAIPQPDVLTVPLAYPMALGDQELVNFINLWIELKKDDKTITALYDYWILGQHAVPTPPRWSVMRNVLHWEK